MPLSITWQNSTKTKVNPEVIQSHLESVLRPLKGVGTVVIELTLVGDKEITQLKSQFLGRTEATDVLSFPNNDKNLDLTGSIAISVDTARRQAGQAGIELIDELKMLSTHGLLHLLGYHHS